MRDAKQILHGRATLHSSLVCRRAAVASVVQCVRPLRSFGRSPSKWGFCCFVRTLERVPLSLLKTLLPLYPSLFSHMSPLPFSFTTLSLFLHLCRILRGGECRGTSPGAAAAVTDGKRNKKEGGKRGRNCTAENIVDRERRGEEGSALARVMFN